MDVGAFEQEGRTASLLPSLVHWYQLECGLRFQGELVWPTR